MSKTAHRIYIFLLAVIVLFITAYIINTGTSYYNTSLEERFFHADHPTFKPSGIMGHGLGIIGSLCMLIGVSIYMARKRWRSLSRLGYLKHWLEFHIFLCTLGPILVLFHTAFKFGGLVAISFWSMVAVFLSGVIGRFIYIQIPRTIEGRELSLNEIRGLKNDIGGILKDSYSLDEESYRIIVESTRRHFDETGGNRLMLFLKKRREDSKTIRRVKGVLKKSQLQAQDSRKILKMVTNEISLNRRIDRLATMQNLFKYWHVVHLPFALVMLVIMVIHVIVTVTFGFRWIF